MNKKIISIVAIIMLVAVLSIALVACNAENYEKRLEKAGYEVVVLEGDEAKEEANSEASVEWVVTAMKGTNIVSIVKYSKLDDAKAAEADLEKLGLGHWDRQSKVIIYSTTEQGLKDAK